MGLREEILQQPDVLSNLLTRGAPSVSDIARALSQREIDLVYVVARGSSDNAGLYAKYLFGIHNRLPVALAIPSLFTLYKAPPRLKNTLVLGISQSGESADLVEALKACRAEGASTVVITNCPESPLADASEFVLDIGAGEETAVAATKTYTGQLLAVAMLSTALANNEEHRRSLATLPTLAEKTLELNSEDSVASIAERYRYMEQCVVLGRGFNYATVFEWSLKLKELTYVVAGPYSSADFRHGPIALVERGFPVLAVLANGAVKPDILDLLAHLGEEKGAEILLVTNSNKADKIAQKILRFPDAPEWQTPLLAILPAQLFTYSLTLAKGFDPEHPRGLRKITTTE